jgi:hypothetical protein
MRLEASLRSPGFPSLELVKHSAVKFPIIADYEHFRSEGCVVQVREEAIVEYSFPGSGPGMSQR